jgi:hypothetical protein
LFYLHGRIIEDQGATPTHPDFGLYDYPAIVAALGARGATVVSTVRPADTNVQAYARQVIVQIEELLDGGVSAESIVVVGFSKGGIITITTSAMLGRSGIRYVVMAACAGWLDDYPQLTLTGNVYSIYEQSDSTVGSCEALAERSESLESFRELQISTGQQHGAFYLPRSDWLEPLLDWVHND